MGRYPKVAIPPQKEETIPTPDEVISSVNKGIDALFTVDTTPELPREKLENADIHTIDARTLKVVAKNRKNGFNINLFCEQENCDKRDKYKEGSTIIWACLRCKHLGVEFV